MQAFKGLGFKDQGQGPPSRPRPRT